MQPSTFEVSAHSGSRFLRISEVSWRTGLRKTALYGRIKAKQFPEPVRLSSRASVWLESDVEAWIQQQAALAKAAA